MLPAKPATSRFAAKKLLRLVLAKLVSSHKLSGSL
jgi:hypothetical protein